MRRAGAIGLLALAVTSASERVCANSVEDFYRNRQVRVVVGNAVGADYDLGARLLTRHMSRHMSGQPGFVVQNMPGAASTMRPTISTTSLPKTAHCSGRSRAICRAKRLSAAIQ